MPIALFAKYEAYCRRKITLIRTLANRLQKTGNAFDHLFGSIKSDNMVHNTLAKTTKISKRNTGAIKNGLCSECVIEQDCFFPNFWNSMHFIHCK